MTGAADPAAERRDFRRVWSAGLVSMAGAAVSGLAIDLLALGQLHVSAEELGLLTALQTGCYILGLPTGALLDRLAARSAMVAADLGRAAAVASLPVAAALGVLSLGQLYAVVLIVAVLTMVFDIAQQSIVPRLVEADERARANATVARVQTGAQLLGPGVAGLLVHAMGAAFAVITDAASYAISAVMLWRVRCRDRPGPATPAVPLRSSLGEGVRFVLQEPVLRRLTLASSLFNAASAAGAILILVRLVDGLGLSSGLVGLITAVGAIGGILGSLAAAPLLRQLETWAVVRASLMLAAVGVPVLAATGPGPAVCFAALGMAVSGTGVVIYNVAQVTYRQRVTPLGLLGRVTAAIRSLVTGSVALGAVAGGWLGDELGARVALLVVGTAALLAVVPLITAPKAPVTAPKALDTAPKALDTAPKALDTAPKAGAPAEPDHPVTPRLV